MPEKQTLERSKKAKKEEKLPASVGLSKTDRTEVDLSSPAKGQRSEKTHFGVEHSYEIGQRRSQEHLSEKRSPSTVKALKQETRRRTASKQAQSREIKQTAHERFFK